MGFLINLQAYENGTFSKFDRSIIWDIYKSKAMPRFRGWDLTYDGNRGGFLSLSDEDPTTGFGLDRPSDPALRDMYEVARQVPCLINWFHYSAVADERYLAGIPDWLLKALGVPPHVVHSGDDLIRCIAQS
jgi:hypothetical protein